MKLVSRLKQALVWRIRLLRKQLLLASARRHRKSLAGTVFVGITGSVGKTTTKDLAVAVLSSRGPTIGNAASLNALVDMAHVVVATKRKHQFAVVEVGLAPHAGIDEKIALAQPRIAVFLVVGRDHIKSFGSVNAIAAEKAKLIHALPADGVAVLNMDDPLVRAAGEVAQTRRIWFGRAAEADIRLVDASSAFPDPLTLTIDYQGRRLKVATQLHGTHLTVPVLAALGIGLAAGIPIEDCIASLAQVRTTPGRMQVVECPDGVTFVRDDYKAPHWSFQTTLDFLRDARARRKVAIIGTLSDYSLSASKLYPKVAREARAVADLVVFVGPHALRALKARNEGDRSIVGFTEIEDANTFLQGELRAGDLVLLKGSNRADHLVRLFLARSREVKCWTFGCGLNRFCDACPRIDSPVPGLQDAGPVSTQPEGGDAPAQTVPAGDKVENVPTSNAWLVVGLGNPGGASARTPHNVGFEALDAIAMQAGEQWARTDDGAVCRCELAGHAVVLFKPAAAINLCGPLVERQRRRDGIAAARVLVVHDDADLPLSDVRVKRGGSDGGHKGLRSLFAALGNDGSMPRVRVGVRTARAGSEGARSLVLQHFAPEDLAAVEESLLKAATLVGELISGSGSGLSRRREQLTSPS